MGEPNCNTPAAGASPSTMVSTAVFCAPSVPPPCGVASASDIVSSPSTALSLLMGTVKVLSAVSPAAQLSVPAAAAMPVR